MFLSYQSSNCGTTGSSYLILLIDSQVLVKTSNKACIPYFAVGNKITSVPTDRVCNLLNR